MSVIKSFSRYLSLPWNLHTISAILFWPTFSVTSYNMVLGLKQQNLRPKTVIDVGANVGQFTVAAAKFFSDSEIYSFEPVPESFLRLQKNVQGLRNVQTYQVALGEREGKTVCHINSHSQSSSILPLATEHRAAFPDAKEIGQVPINISTMDLIFAEKTLESPVLLKLDVQGYEMAVVQGAPETLKRVEYVIAETSFKSLYQGEPLFMDLVMLMELHGFQFARPVGWLSDPKTGEILQMDALFIRQN